ncbi:MAG TPA: hypothetical protein V6C84_00665 [Coleofasciculaceae cyanobacterium]|jgi:hypothetical protein
MYKPQSLKSSNWLLAGLVVLSGALIPTSADANVDYSLLVGEWAGSGLCDSSRYVFTQDERYLWIENKNGRWNTLYEGIYFPLDDRRLNRLSLKSPGAVIVADGPNMGGSMIEVHTLTQATYSGMWNVALSDGLSFDNPDNAFFAYVRCPAR